MKNVKHKLFIVLTLVFGTLLLFDGMARAGDLTINSPTAFSTLAPGGTLTVNGNLTITANGTINSNISGATVAGNINLIVTGNIEQWGDILAEAKDIGGNITITVGGHMHMYNGATISSSKTDGSANNDKAGDITINLTGSDTGDNLTVDFGAVIKADSSKNKRAGNIDINGKKLITINGLVESQVFAGLTGTGRRGDGGSIFIDSICNIVVGATGVVISSGHDMGADLVHLAACKVDVNGLLVSTGDGGAAPNDTFLSQGTRPHYKGNPPVLVTSVTAAIEVWGSKVKIDHGELDADLTGAGGTAGISWIDILATEQILIKDAYIHADGLGGTNDTGGLIMIKSDNNSVTSKDGSTIEASATKLGGAGGFITIEASQNVDLTDTQVLAEGAKSGGAPKGGNIASISANGCITGNTPGQLNVTGGNSVSSAGKVKLTACCSPISYAGTITPVLPELHPGVCGIPIVMPIYFIPPDCSSCCTWICVWTCIDP